MTEGYRLAFDAAKEPLHFAGLLTPMLTLCGVGLLSVVLPQPMVDRILPNGPKGLLGKLFGFLFLAIVGSVTLFWVSYRIVQYQGYRSAERSGKLEFVSGCLEGFHPMPAEGHEQELVKVAGKEFSYSDFDASTPGFNNTASHGGPIHADSKVRIGFLGPSIIRLEVVDHACPAAPDLPRLN